jgi:hypothetical protein
MTIYRTIGAWGAGKGSDLTAAEVDNNFWDAIQRIIALETVTSMIGAEIDYFSVVGDQLTVHMTDHSLRGPYTIPTADYTFRGTWQASTAYSKLDIVTINGNVYLVIYPHTSDTSFDAGANDGAGHDYYGLLLTNPGNSLPTGGAVGQVLTKSTTADFATTWSDPIPNTPVMNNASSSVYLHALTNGAYTRMTSPSSTVIVSVLSDAEMLAAGVSIQVGAEFHIRQATSTPIDIIPSGSVTINSSHFGHYLGTSFEGATFTLKKVAANEYDMIGPPGPVMSGFSP